MSEGNEKVGQEKHDYQNPMLRVQREEAKYVECITGVQFIHTFLSNVPLFSESGTRERPKAQPQTYMDYIMSTSC